jgi:hypothetical protein
MKPESNPEMKPEYDLENMRPADQTRHRELLARHKNRAALVQLEDGSSHLETFEDEVRVAMVKTNLPDETDLEIKTNAYHEAAHAVFLKLFFNELGYEITEINVRRTKTLDGKLAGAIVKRERKGEYKITSTLEYSRSFFAMTHVARIAVKYFSTSKALDTREDAFRTDDQQENQTIENYIAENPKLNRKRGPELDQEKHDLREEWTAWLKEQFEKAGISQTIECLAEELIRRSLDANLPMPGEEAEEFISDCFRDHLE